MLTSEEAAQLTPSATRDDLDRLFVQVCQRVTATLLTQQAAAQRALDEADAVMGATLDAYEAALKTFNAAEASALRLAWKIRDWQACTAHYQGRCDAARSLAR